MNESGESAFSAAYNLQVRLRDESRRIEVAPVPWRLNLRRIHAATDSLRMAAARLGATSFPATPAGEPQPHELEQWDATPWTNEHASQIVSIAEWTGLRKFEAAVLLAYVESRGEAAIPELVGLPAPVVQGALVKALEAVGFSPPPPDEVGQALAQFFRVVRDAVEEEEGDESIEHESHGRWRRPNE